MPRVATYSLRPALDCVSSRDTKCNVAPEHKAMKISEVAASKAMEANCKTWLEAATWNAVDCANAKLHRP